MKKYLTLDVGGSSIKYALIQEDLTIIEKSHVPTPLDTLDHFVETVGEIYDKYAHAISGMAISMPGSIDPQRGYSFSGGSLSYIQNIHTQDILQKRCPIAMTIGNDAKCGALAEVGFGSLKDVNDAVVIILGSGIGGCLIHNREIIMGKHFFAGEFSFVKTDIHQKDNIQEHWTMKNGITGLLKRVQKELKTDQEYTGKEIFAMANQGNEDVLRAIDSFTKDLAFEIYNLQTIFDPERFAIGGGISVQPILFESLQKNIKQIMNEMPFPVPYPEVVPCQFRNDANLLGALYQYMQTYK